MADGGAQLRRAQEQARASAELESARILAAEVQRSAEQAAQDEAAAEGVAAMMEVVTAFVNTMARAGNPGAKPCKALRWIGTMNTGFTRRVPGALGWVISEPKHKYDKLSGPGIAVLADARVLYAWSEFEATPIFLDTSIDPPGELRLARPQDVSVSALAAVLERYGLTP